MPPRRRSSQQIYPKRMFNTLDLDGMIEILSNCKPVEAVLPNASNEVQRCYLRERAELKLSRDSYSPNGLISDSALEAVTLFGPTIPLAIRKIFEFMHCAHPTTSIVRSYNIYQHIHEFLFRTKLNQQPSQFDLLMKVFAEMMEEIRSANLTTCSKHDNSLWEKFKTYFHVELGASLQGALQTTISSSRFAGSARLHDGVAQTQRVTGESHPKQPEERQPELLNFATRKDIIATLQKINSHPDDWEKLQRYYSQLRLKFKTTIKLSSLDAKLISGEELKDEKFFSDDVPLVVRKLFEFTMSAKFKRKHNGVYELILSYLKGEIPKQRDLLIRVLNLLGKINLGVKKTCRNKSIMLQREFVAYFVNEFITVTAVEYRQLKSRFDRGEIKNNPKAGANIFIEANDVVGEAEIQKELLRMYTIIFAYLLSKKPEAAHRQLVKISDDGQKLIWPVSQADLNTKYKTAKSACDVLLEAMQINETEGAMPNEEVYFTHLAQVSVKENRPTQPRRKMSAQQNHNVPATPSAEEIVFVQEYGCAEVSAELSPSSTPLPSDSLSSSYSTQGTMFARPPMLPPTPVLPPISELLRPIEEQHEAASILSAISEPAFSARSNVPTLPAIGEFIFPVRGPSALTLFAPVQRYSTSDPPSQHAGDKRVRSIDSAIGFWPTRNVRPRADGPAEPTKTGPVLG